MRNQVQLAGALSRRVAKNNVRDVFKSNNIGLKLNDPKLVGLLGKINSSLNFIAENLQKFGGGNTPETVLDIDVGANETFTKLSDDLVGVGKLFTEIIPSFNKVGDLISELVKKDFTNIKFPQIQKVEGEINVKNQLSETLFETITSKLELINKSIGQLVPLLGKETKIEMPKVVIPEFPKFPKIPEFPKSITVNDFSRMLTSLDALEKAIKEIPSEIKFPTNKTVEFPASIAVNNFPPTKYPMPATHMSINSLKGSLNAGTITVGTTSAAIPLSNLPNRRSILIYNSSSTDTLYIGGQTVTASGSNQGIPIPPLSYAPSLDAGEDMIIYGITSSGSLVVNFLEISDESSGR